MFNQTNSLPTLPLQTFKPHSLAAIAPSKQILLGNLVTIISKQVYAQEHMLRPIHTVGSLPVELQLVRMAIPAKCSS